VNLTNGGPPCFCSFWVFLVNVVGEIPLGNFGYFLVRVVRRNFEKFAVFVGNFAVSHFVLGAWAI